IPRRDGVVFLLGTAISAPVPELRSFVAGAIGKTGPSHKPCVEQDPHAATHRQQERDSPITGEGAPIRIF
ncbi:MAG: hypothetical protein ACK40C_11800, partial [Novosphingobium meiothermophilum]